MIYAGLRKSLLAGLLGAVFLFLFYFGLTLLLTREWPHALERLAAFKWWVLVFALGLGAQVGLMKYNHLQCGKSSVFGAIFSGGSGTFGMIACCLHHLADLSILGISVGIFGAALRYQNFLLWLGLAINIAGIIYLSRKILVHTNPSRIA